jgi:anti-anti-sigma factor
VILDLTDVVYIDSAGIQLLYRLGEGLRTRGQVLRIVIPGDSPVNDALRLAGIKHHADVVEAVDDGLRALANVAS